MKAPTPLQEERLEAERMQDVLLLLEHLSRSQETTIKLIIDCLYDVGSVKLINKKVPSPPLNRVSKSIASMSKPVFRVVAFYWFKRNCPQIITDWLTKKLSFEQQAKPLGKKIAEEAPSPVVDLYRSEGSSTQGSGAQGVARSLPPSPSTYQASQEIKRLRTQVRLLMGMLVGTVVVLGSTTLWLMQDTGLQPVQLRHPVQSTLSEGCASEDEQACVQP
ncbi:MAG: hypothetical protein VKK04_02600 [Synechococcales bacterium]|nr:hypothetical protein [Synechococcales bacterium]